MKKYIVRLTAEEQTSLSQMIRSGKASARTLLHARILLKADSRPEAPAWSDEAVSEALEVHATTVARVRQRFVEEGLEVALRPQPTTRRYERKLDGQAEAHLLALACGPAPEGQAKWTLRLLADKLVELQHVDSVSCEIESTCCSSTSLSASRRKVHFACPSGAGPQAKARRCASAWPSSLRSYRRVVGWGRKATSRPSSTKRWRTRATVVACTSSASLTASSLQAGASGRLSAFSRMRAWSKVRAEALPLRIIWEREVCSSAVNRTMYFFMGRVSPEKPPRRTVFF